MDIFCSLKFPYLIIIRGPTTTLKLSREEIHLFFCRQSRVVVQPLFFFLCLPIFATDLLPSQL